MNNFLCDYAFLNVTRYHLIEECLHWSFLF